MAVDDHHQDGRSPGGVAYTMVKAESLDPDSILHARKNRHCHPSQGLEIVDVHTTDGHSKLTCARRARSQARRHHELFAST